MLAVIRAWFVIRKWRSAVLRKDWPEVKRLDRKYAALMRARAGR